MKILEILSEQTAGKDPAKEEIIKDFIAYASKKLHIKIPMTIEFSYDTQKAQQEKHTGAYDWHKNRMWVYSAHRNLVDILRTVCHELMHAKQDQEGRIKRHSPPGSKLEREADEAAGYLIKLYGKQHPEVFQ